MLPDSVINYVNVTRLISLSYDVFTIELFLNANHTSYLKKTLPKAQKRVLIISPDSQIMFIFTQ